MLSYSPGGSTSLHSGTPSSGESSFLFSLFSTASSILSRACALRLILPCVIILTHQFGYCKNYLKFLCVYLCSNSTVVVGGYFYLKILSDEVYIKQLLAIARSLPCNLCSISARGVLAQKDSMSTVPLSFGVGRSLSCELPGAADRSRSLYSCLRRLSVGPAGSAARSGQPKNST